MGEEREKGIKRKEKKNASNFLFLSLFFSALAFLSHVFIQLIGKLFCYT